MYRMGRMEWVGDWRTDLIHPPHKGAGGWEADLPNSPAAWARPPYQRNHS